MEALGRRIAKERAALGWTQARLAERIGVSRVALSHLEAGMSVANERTVVLLSATFGLEPYELVAGTDYPEAKSERLPLVAARHTEVDLQLALLASDLGWLDTVATVAEPVVVARLRADTLQRWADRLVELSVRVADRAERERLTEASRSVARHRRGPGGATPVPGDADAGSEAREDPGPDVC